MSISNNFLNSHLNILENFHDFVYSRFSTTNGNFAFYAEEFDKLVFEYEKIEKVKVKSVELRQRLYKLQTIFPLTIQYELSKKYTFNSELTMRIEEH